jgi:hypothetical protein
MPTYTTGLLNAPAVPDDPRCKQGRFSASVIAFHEKAGRSQVGSFVFSLDKVFLPPSRRHCRHPSIRTLIERVCSLGASWVFSFQPVLPPVSRPLFLSRGSRARRLTQSPELGFGSDFFSSQECFALCRGPERSRATVVQRFIRFSAHPQLMQQHR